MSQSNHAARLREMAESYKKEAPTLYLVGADEWAKKNETTAEALLAGAAALDRTTPEPIGDKHRDGEQWLVWDADCMTWNVVTYCRRTKAWWHGEGFKLVLPTMALEMPQAESGYGINDFLALEQRHREAVGLLRELREARLRDEELQLSLRVVEWLSKEKRNESI